MVFKRKSGGPADARRLTVSDWPEGEVADEEAPAPAPTTDQAQGEAPEDDDAPLMDLDQIRDAILRRSTDGERSDDSVVDGCDGADARADSTVDPGPSSSVNQGPGSSVNQGGPGRNYYRRRSSGVGTNGRRSSFVNDGRAGVSRRISWASSFNSAKDAKGPAKEEDAPTVAPSSSASRTSLSSSAGTNIWTKLLGGSASDGLWDGLNSKSGNVYDEDFDDDDNSKEDACRASVKRCGLAGWYEARHFCGTVVRHPHIWMLSLLAFGVVCGIGMAAIQSERDAYVKKQKSTATFVAQETAQWFSNEFRRAMLPLYSVQQGVLHSGYFDGLAGEIGNYPNLLIPESEETPFTKRDVRGICDRRELVDKWRSIVQPINEENDLDGVVVGYRLFPANVACLTEPHEEESSEGFNAEDFPQGEALLASNQVFGLDTGHSAFPLWEMITTDLFVNKQFNVFGPFAMPPMNELICGHLAIWTNPDEDTSSEALDVHGTKVENAWGFVVNFLDWTKLKEKSDIYQRFADCKLEFRLTRAGGATVEGIDTALLAESPQADLLDDENSIVVETESLHGVWQNQVGSLSGWTPPWYPAAVAGVVITSLLLAFLTASTLVERQLHRDLLYKVMPRRAIQKLSRGQTVLEKFNLVTIFFSDIVGFTSMAGNMRPIQVMKMLNELYTELDKIVEKHGVYKVETIGDAYMVVGGAPDRCPAPLAAEKVARFALEAVEFVKNFRTKDGDRVFIRAGLASGPTVAGVVGQAMPRYCFFGDTVNFASRMESTSKKMKIQAAEITYRLLRDAPNMNFELTKRMEGEVAGVEIKGKGHQITYWIEDSSPRSPSGNDMETYHEKIEADPEAPTGSDEEASDRSDTSDGRY
ncbi:hypothetical protein ACHAXT_011816, partial [Thalassiosira profunda]